MKTTLIILSLAATLLSCTKTETPVPATTVSHPTTTTPAIVGHWQYAFDTCKKLVVTTDSITSMSCSASVIHSYVSLSGDTISTNGQTIIMKIVGDTLFYVPAPYTVWDNKYYRLP